MAYHKKRNDSEEGFGRLRLPRKDELEMFGVVQQLHGGNQIKVLCADEQERMCRIPGKMMKRVWVRQGDLVIVKLWDFQPIKADIVWRYIGNQVEWLKRKGHLEGLKII